MKVTFRVRHKLHILLQTVATSVPRAVYLLLENREIFLLFALVTKLTSLCVCVGSQTTKVYPRCRAHRSCTFP